MTNWVEVFRAGTHTANSGEKVSFSPSEVAAVAKSYDPSYFESPLVLGHPKENAPAYGWVETLKSEGGKLFAKFRQVHDRFAQAVREGRFKNRSVSLYKDLDGRGPYLRHVGFLGAAPPAVKGMAPGKFAAGEDLTFEFEEKENPMDAKQIKDAVSETMQSFSEKITAAMEKLRPGGGGEPSKDVKAQIDTAVEEAAQSIEQKFSEQVKALKSELTAAQEKIVVGTKESARRTIETFVERMRHEGHWASGVDLKAAADTNQTATLHATQANRQLAAGDGVALVTTGTLTAVAGVSLRATFRRL